jgi:predicted TIM-barrel fold metal-dependent hydrolase
MALLHFLYSLALVGLLFSCSSSKPAESTTQDQTDMAERIEWVDVHVHLVGGRRGRVHDYGGAARVALKAMDEAGIRMSVVMPPPQPPGFPVLYDYDSFISYLKRYPKRFAFLGGGGTLNPMIHEAGKRKGKISKHVRRRFEEKANEIIRRGGVGFGEITAHHYSLMSGHPYESVSADHPLLLLLADIAARHDVVIDLHFDVVVEDVTHLPPRLASQANPPRLIANIAGFERLLAHDREAKIVWAHAGSDMLGHWTVGLSREMLRKHPNLFMSLRMGGGVPRNRVLNEGGDIKPQWLALFRDFPDRFVIGGDQFFASPQIRGSGPGLEFGQHARRIREGSKTLLSKLPPDLSRKIGCENAVRLYKLDG